MSLPREKTEQISWRAILIGLLLIPINTYGIAMTEMVWSIHLTTASLPLNVVFILLFLVLLNRLIKFIAPNFILSPSEWLIIYIILAASSAISGYDSMVVLMGVIPHAFWYDTVENDWASLFHSYIPKWLVVSDRKVARGFYRGEESFFTAGYIDSWITPILTWSALIVLLIIIMLLINVIIRKQWTEREKLTYPIIQLPLEMTNEKTFLFGNRLMWIGFAIAAVIDLLNGLNYLYPSVPYIPTRGINLQKFFTDKPFNAIGWTHIAYRPFILGLTYLLPWDLSFSCWFFFILHKSFRVWSSAAGWLSIPGFPFSRQQSTGGLIGFSIIALVSSRKYLINVLKTVFIKRGEDDSHEPISYRKAFAGIIIASFLLFIFCTKAGMSPWVFFLFFTLYFAISLALTRIRAELGIPEHLFLYVSPQNTMITVLGTRKHGNRNLTLFALFSWFTQRYRNHPMPHQLEGFKIAEQARISSKGILWTMLMATVAGVIATFIIFPYTIYKYGAEIRPHGGMVVGGWMAFNNLKSWLHNPQAPNGLGSAFTAGGMLFTFFLAFMRRKFIWWPFHPGGYVLARSVIEDYWFTMMLSSTIKLIILRYGGAKAYRRSIPFFLGLILGDTVLASGWALLGVIVDSPMYAVWT